MSLFQVIPFALLASVYEKPSTEPVFRPKRPCKLGPILFASPSPRVWHCAQRVLNRLAPFFASPIDVMLVMAVSESYVKEKHQAQGVGKMRKSTWRFHALA